MVCGGECMAGGGGAHHDLLAPKREARGVSGEERADELGEHVQHDVPLLLLIPLDDTDDPQAKRDGRVDDGTADVAEEDAVEEEAKGGEDGAPNAERRVGDRRSVPAVARRSVADRFRGRIPRRIPLLYLMEKRYDAAGRLVRRRAAARGAAHMTRSVVMKADMPSAKAHRTQSSVEL